MPPSLVWELALVECPISVDPVWMVLTGCHRIVHGISFWEIPAAFNVALLDDRSQMGGWDLFMICSPLLCIGRVCMLSE